MSAAVKLEKKTKLTFPNDRTLRTERVFDAPQSRVWKAYTDPKQLAQWWGRGQKCTIERHELRRGGHWRFVVYEGKAAQGFEGRFREVTPEDRIVQSFEWDGMPGHVCIETVTFEDLGDRRTRLVTESLFHTAEECAVAAQSGMEEGVNDSYEALDRVLASK